MNANSTLPSERVVIAAPLSFTGSAARIWKITRAGHRIAIRATLGVVAAMLILCAWTIVLAWYVAFGLLLVPYRVVRRGQRKNKRDRLRHRELLTHGSAPIKR